MFDFIPPEYEQIVNLIFLVVTALIAKHGITYRNEDATTVQYRIKATNDNGISRNWNTTDTITLPIVGCMDDTSGIHPDIYELYYKQQDQLVYYKTASIPDFKTSVFMNGLFRNIKENTNLDLLEESDDEDEFQDISPSKYVNLEKKHIMKCVYIKRFKRWQPLEVSSNASISKIKDIAIF